MYGSSKVVGGIDKGTVSRIRVKVWVGRLGLDRPCDGTF